MIPIVPQPPCQSTIGQVMSLLIHYLNAHVRILLSNFYDVMILAFDHFSKYAFFGKEFFFFHFEYKGLESAQIDLN